MLTYKNNYQGKLLERNRNMIREIIEETHEKSLPSTATLMKTLKSYMNVTQDGMVQYCEGEICSTVTMDCKDNAPAVWDFINSYEVDTRILFLEKYDGRFHIVFYWKSELEKDSNFSISIRENSISVSQNITKHTLSFDERIVTGQENAFKEIFEDFEGKKNARETMLKE